MRIILKFTTHSHFTRHTAHGTRRTRHTLGSADQEQERIESARAARVKAQEEKAKAEKAAKEKLKQDAMEARKKEVKIANATKQIQVKERIAAAIAETKALEDAHKAEQVSLATRRSSASSRAFVKKGDADAVGSPASQAAKPPDLVLEAAITKSLKGVNEGRVSSLFTKFESPGGDGGGGAGADHPSYRKGSGSNESSGRLNKFQKGGGRTHSVNLSSDYD